MDDWLRQIRDDLARLEEKDLLRQLTRVEVDGRVLTRDGAHLVNLASNDYLAISRHPRLCEEAIEAVRRYGIGAGASRVTSGHLGPHEDLETRFAQFKHAEAALLCSTGYMANLAVLGALAQGGDLICVDKLNHASLIDAARASGATVRVYPHGDLKKLHRLLARYQPPGTRREAPLGDHSGETDRPPRRFIVTDSVFSMDGDCADLRGLCDLADAWDAILVVDEAHGTGVLGETGAGLIELAGVGARVDIVVSTASKALGGLGGIITARREVIQMIINQARSFVYTTGAMPVQAAAIGAALEVMRAEPWRRRRLQQLAHRLRKEAAALSLIPPARRPDTPDTPDTPIVPIFVGPSRGALDLSRHLYKHGLFAPAIRPPSVPRGTARVRISLRADLTDADMQQLIGALRAWRQEWDGDRGAKSQSRVRDPACTARNAGETPAPQHDGH